MLFVAKTVPDLLVVEGTENIIEEIGKTAVEVATLMSEYVESSSIASKISSPATSPLIVLMRDSTREDNKVSDLGLDEKSD
jgi:hypothetical protein